MNFFNSVFADDPDPPNSGSESESESAPSTNQDPDPIPTPAANAGWNFGDLIKTIATKSETVIETYRRDLQEFGSGLKKEIEVAQGSLETVGTKIDELGTTVFQGTAQIISQGMLGPDHESESDSSDSNTQGYASQRSLNSQTYSRFESQVRAIQGDVSTYCEEPEDLEEYRKWRSEFVLEEKRAEIEGLLEGNGAMESIYNRVAPSVVDDETFWCRYYFRVYKLKLAESVRANLVKRAISVEEDEELSWDVDDDEHGSNVAAAEANVVDEEESSAEELQSGASEEVVQEKKENAVESSGEKESEQKVDVAGDSVVPSKLEEEKKVDVQGDSGEKDLPSKSDDRAAAEVKNEESGVSAASVAALSAEPEEEDLGWDEIEDLSSIDEKKANIGASGGTADRAELQKRLSIAEEEDLSWDIDDDDDEPAKA